MATQTTNYKLRKPELSDVVNVESDLNANMDKIDKALGGLGDGLAIVSNGNTHAAITSGQFVYVRNHSSLDEGLYTATANIAQNATLSSSNVTADAIGGLNALNAKITDVSDGTTKYISIDVTSYSRDDKEGWDEAYSQLGSTYNGTALLRFKNNYNLTCIVQKYSSNWGSILGVLNDNKDPYFYKVAGSYTYLDNLASTNSLALKILEKTSSASHDITVPSSSRFFIMASTSGNTRYWIGYIIAGSSGGISVAELVKGSNTTVTATTNNFNIAFDTAAALNVTYISLYGNKELS